MDIEVIERDPDFSVIVTGPMVVVLWHNCTAVEALERVTKKIAAHGERYGERVDVLAIMTPKRATSPPPPTGESTPR